MEVFCVKLLSLSLSTQHNPLALYITHTLPPAPSRLLRRARFAFENSTHLSAANIIPAFPPPSCLNPGLRAPAQYITVPISHGNSPQINPTHQQTALHMCSLGTKWPSVSRSLSRRAQKFDLLRRLVQSSGATMRRDTRRRALMADR